MRNYFKPISISLSPNVEKDDIRLALNLIIRPWLWKKGKATLELEDEFKKYLGVKYAVSFNSGRSAFYAILKAMEASVCKDVLLQAFTCNASINPVLWANLNPVYVDCNKDNFNIDINDLKQKIAKNPQAKILLVQHTFGSPANMDEIDSIVRQYNLTLIEDCAHSLGAKFDGKKIGNFGKASFFSFSRDKIISSVYGGMATTNDDKLGEALIKLQKEFKLPNRRWIFQQIIHPILLGYFILPIYNFLDLGKIFLVLSQWFHVLSKAVSWKEKRGQRPDCFPKALPNALAILALHQFKKMDKFYNHRKKLYDKYAKEFENTSFSLPIENSKSSPSHLRLTVKHKDAHEIIYEAWHNQNILLGDWFTTPIAPADTNLEEMHYKNGMCPVAENLSKITLNLPTHINILDKDFDRIIKFLKKYDRY